MVAEKLGVVKFDGDKNPNQRKYREPHQPPAGPIFHQIRIDRVRNIHTNQSANQNGVGNGPRKLSVGIPFYERRVETLRYLPITPNSCFLMKRIRTRPWAIAYVIVRSGPGVAFPDDEGGLMDLKALHTGDNEGPRNHFHRFRPEYQNRTLESKDLDICGR